MGEGRRPRKQIARLTAASRLQFSASIFINCKPRKCLTSAQCQRCCRQPHRRHSGHPISGQEDSALLQNNPTTRKTSQTFATSTLNDFRFFLQFEISVDSCGYCCAEIEMGNALRCRSGVYETLGALAQVKY